MKHIVCQKCGGQLLYEEIGSYGRIHKLRSDGSICKRVRTQLYDMDDASTAMVYCSNCCEGKEFIVDDEGRVSLI